MNRDGALAEIRKRVANPNLVKHMLASEAVMLALARRFAQDEAEWGLAGLLHDIDLDLCKGDMAVHSRMGADIASSLGAGAAVAHAILAHNEAHGEPQNSLMDKALFCTDPLTGLITACALVRPDKKLQSVAVSSVMKRFGEKRFAAGVNREQIAYCSQIGLQTGEFVALGLTAMQGIAADLGL